MGLLDNFNIDDPRTMGLLNAGLTMLGNSGASRTPVNLGQILGSGLQAYTGTQDEFRKRKQQEAEAAQMAKIRDLQMQQDQMQIGDLQQKMREREIAKQYQAKLPSLIAQFGNDYRGMISAGIPPDLVKQIAESKNYGRDEVARVEETVDEKGMPIKRQLSKFGDKLGDMGKYVAPVQINRGDRIDMVIPSAGQSFKMGLSPSNQVTIRGQNMADERARETNEINRQGQRTQIINDPTQGILLVDKGTGFGRKATFSTGETIPSETESKKIAAANNILPILDEADKLIGKETSSYIGAGIDVAGRVVGAAPKGAQTISKLKVLEGALMANMPRMEGPQSDKDVALYRQNAGLIGDSTIPSPQKKSALEQIRAINEKYSSATKRVKMSWQDYYSTKEDAIRDAKNAIMRNPAAKQSILQRLKDSGIDTGGM